MRPGWIRTLLRRATDDRADESVLRRYRSTLDPAALDAVVGRYAGMVWSVCRRLSGRVADSEDAFQTTFLTLALAVQRGTPIRHLGGWLQRVAVNAARKVRQRRIASLGSDRGAFDPALDRIDEADEQRVLHEALAELPEHHRTAVILIDLEGLSHADAARRLGWPVGTLSGRLVRGRQELRRRLERRGDSLLPFVTESASAELVQRAVRSLPSELTPVALELLDHMHAITLARRMLAASACLVLAVCVAGAIALAQPAKPTGETKPPANGNPTADADWNDPKLAPTALPDLKPALRPPFADSPESPTVWQEDPPLTKVRKRRLIALQAELLLIGKRLEADVYTADQSPRVLALLREMGETAGNVYATDRAKKLDWFGYRVRCSKAIELYFGARVKGKIDQPVAPPMAQSARYEAEEAYLLVKASEK